ncbi:MAG: FAD-dependent oxidoreductase [Clostridia bacterium]|nr:CoA-disulfide reductase [Clostridia bacterium]
MKGRKIAIVGGVAGGASAAARLRRLDEHAHIIIFERGQYISYANCGLPYYVGGVIKDRNELLVQTPERMAKRFNIDVRINSEVEDIDLERKELIVLNRATGERYRESFDKLILAPGAEPIKPPIPGIEKANLFTVRDISRIYALKDYIDKEKPDSAVVVGGGFIGLEMAENLRLNGIKVWLVELLNQVMPPLDFDMAAYLHRHLREHSVELCLGDGVVSFDRDEKQTIVNLKSGKQLKTDMVVLAVGVRPETILAQKAGLEIGETGGIKVNQHLQTSHPDVYAIGDAIEVIDFVNGRPALIPLAGPANKQGRIAANHICGIEDTYKATQGTAIIKVFDMVAACTGNNEKVLKKYGIPYLKSYTHAGSHASYYPGATSMAIKLLFSPDNGKILGAQIVGHDGVDKRIDVLATAIRAGMTVYDLQELELAYAPPFSSAKDPVNIAGYVASNILQGLHPVIHWDDLDKLDRQYTVLLDVRTPAECKATGIIPGAINIPIDSLRERIDELPRDKTIVIYCQVGLRGYIATRMLMQRGFSRVYNLSGGYITYSMAKQGQ